jgi:uncharacterized Rossmann fold enzyme
MAYSTSQDHPWLEQRPQEDGWLHVVGYGPSLEDTWSQISGPCITMSGAHDFLIERGVIPTWHTDMDPRAHKVWLITPHREVSYLIAGVCHPTIWERLAGCKVQKYHVLSSKKTPEWLRKNEKPGAVLVGGGSEIGLAAIHIGGVLGFRRFKLHGFDHSLRHGRRHAGKHGGPGQRLVKWRVGRRIFDTTKIMINAAIECMDTFDTFPIECEIKGDGLLQEMVRTGSRGEEWQTFAPSTRALRPLIPV